MKDTRLEARLDGGPESGVPLNSRIKLLAGRNNIKIIFRMKDTHYLQS